MSDADKLDALRHLDHFREWRSLDDRRYCLVCGEIITGRQIQIASTRGNGALQLSCPSQRCNSVPMDWVLPTDEILASVEMKVAEERKAAASTPARRHNGHPAPPHKEHDSIAARFRKFAFHFKPRS